MPLSATKIMREILFVPPSMPAMDLLAKMQATRIHLALVIDEYGGTDGLVSIEDIVEQIVGEIADEHDEDELPAVVHQPDGSFIADARANLEDVTAIVGSDFDVGDAAEEVDTLGGYLVTRAGRLPLRGELIPGPGLFEFEVLDADPRRVKRVRITRLKEKRERPREPRRRGEPDARPAGRRAGDSARHRDRRAERCRSARRRFRGERAQAVILTRTAHSIVLAWGWRRAAIAFAAGAVSALALAPFNAWPVLFLTFPVLVWLVDGSADAGGRGFWAAAGAGWCFGFGYFVAGLYWIGYAFLVDAKTFGWLLPFAVTGLPAYLALYTGLGLGVARLIWVRGPYAHSGARASRSPPRNGCAGTCSPAFPGTPSAMRSPSRWRWRKPCR